VQLPQLAPHGEPDAVDALRESTDQNVGVLLSTLAFGVPATSTEPPLGARKLMRQLLASGADITDMLRAYRYGHELTWRHWSTFVAEQLLWRSPRTHKPRSTRSGRCRGDVLSCRPWAMEVQDGKFVRCGDYWNMTDFLHQLGHTG
jgi:hypothetical protein